MVVNLSLLGTVIFLMILSLICLYLDYRWNWDEDWRNKY